MKQTLNEQFRRMQKLAGIITENQINEAKKINLTPVQKKEFFDAIEDLSAQEDFEYALGEAGNVLANIITNGEAEYIEDVEDFGYDAEEVEQYAMDLAGESELDENKKSYYKDAEKDDADDYDYNDYDLDIEFQKAPNEAPYNDVLDIIKSYEDESVLNDFKAEFPEGEPVKKKDYSRFAMTLIDDMSEVSYIQANWISMFDEEVYDKAGLI
jgi:hypothetical protein